jgi:hypothetical protein
MGPLIAIQEYNNAISVVFNYPLGSFDVVLAAGISQLLKDIFGPARTINMKESAKKSIFIISSTQ